MIYMIGIGPGDPELLTLKAARLLAGSDLVYVPQSNDSGRSVAESIVSGHVAPEKIRHAYVPMTRDQQRLAEVYSSFAKEIATLSSSGKTVSFVTIGDSMLYSTAWHVGRILSEMGQVLEYVAGIPSYIAAANQTGFCLGTGRDAVHIKPMPDTMEGLLAVLQPQGSTVLMKINKRVGVLHEYVKQYKPQEALLVYRVGLNNETIYNLCQMDSIPEELGYLSIALIRP